MNIGIEIITELDNKQRLNLNASIYKEIKEGRLSILELKNTYFGEYCEYLTILELEKRGIKYIFAPRGYEGFDLISLLGEKNISVKGFRNSRKNKINTYNPTFTSGKVGEINKVKNSYPVVFVEFFTKHENLEPNFYILPSGGTILLIKKHYEDYYQRTKKNPEEREVHKKKYETLNITRGDLIPFKDNWEEIQK